MSRRPGGRVAAAVAAVIVLVAGGLAAAALLGGARPELRPGDCVRHPGSDQATTVEVVDCAAPHEFEVVGSVTLGDAPYPGDDGAFSLAMDRCEQVFAGYVGGPPPAGPWYLNVFTPSAEGWDGGDRTATCLAFRYTEDGAGFAITEGSLRGGNAEA